MKKFVKYPFVVIMAVVIIIGMPFTIGYLYKERHKASTIDKAATDTPSVTAAATASPTPTVSPSITGEPSPGMPSVSPSVTEEPGRFEPIEPTPTPYNKPHKNYSFVTVPNEYFDDALFIGDSRTVGLSEYAPFKGATYFANVGMSAHNAMTTKVSVPSVGKLTLKELLKRKSYGKIYIMLGINELGYKFDSIISKYSNVLETVRELQPDAIVYIEANLHVTKVKSDSDSMINNAAIDKLNESLSQLADGKTVFYIDVNQVFDDGSGNLDSSYTSDNAHILGKYYAQWGEWITTQAIQK